MKMNINKTNYLKKYFSALMILMATALFSQKKFTLVLDAGHGDHDHGAVNYYSDLGNVSEKDIALDVVLRVGRMIEKDKNFKLIYTRKTDIFLPLIERSNIANRNKADLFVSVHINSATNRAAYGTETFVQGPNQNKENLEVAKAENSVIFLDNQDKETFASYDPSSPESLIALKIQQSKYLEKSLILGGLVEENFVNKDNRYSRGVKQQNLHVLRKNAMPSVLIEIGFLSNYDDAHYITSERGKDAIAKSIYNAIMSYKKRVDKYGNNTEPVKPAKPAEVPLKNDFRILLMSSPNRYATNAPELKGLNYILPIKEGNIYKYYYANTNLASVRDNNLKTAKDAGFRNALAISFVPNQKLNTGYYTLELLVTDKKISSNAPLLQTLKNVERTKENGKFYYTYGKYSTLEEAVTAQKDIDSKGIKNTTIQKVLK